MCHSSEAFVHIHCIVIALLLFAFQNDMSILVPVFCYKKFFQKCDFNFVFFFDDAFFALYSGETYSLNDRNYNVKFKDCNIKRNHVWLSLERKMYNPHFKTT